VSIDSAQGREYELVILSLVRTKGQTHKFVEDFNRVNVALTRAKHGLVIVGNAETLKQNEVWQKLLFSFQHNIVNGIDEAKQWILWQQENHRLNAAAQNNN